MTRANFLVSEMRIDALNILRRTLKEARTISGSCRMKAQGVTWHNGMSAMPDKHCYGTTTEASR